MNSTCKSGCSRLVDYLDTVEAGNNTRIFCCLSLLIIKVCWYGHHAFLYDTLVTNVILGSIFELLQNLCCDLLRQQGLYLLLFVFVLEDRPVLFVALDFKRPLMKPVLDVFVAERFTNHSFGVKEGRLRLSYSSLLGSSAYLSRVISNSDAYHGWCRSRSLLILDHFDMTISFSGVHPAGHCKVCGSCIDPDDDLFFLCLYHNKVFMIMNTDKIWLIHFYIYIE